MENFNSGIHNKLPINIAEKDRVFSNFFHNQFFILSLKCLQLPDMHPQCPGITWGDLSSESALIVTFAHNILTRLEIIDRGWAKSSHWWINLEIIYHRLISNHCEELFGGEEITKSCKR